MLLPHAVQQAVDLVISLTEDEITAFRHMKSISDAVAVVAGAVRTHRRVARCGGACACDLCACCVWFYARCYTSGCMVAGAFLEWYFFRSEMSVVLCLPASPQLCMLFDQSPSWKQAVVILADPNFKRRIASMHPQHLQVR